MLFEILSLYHLGTPLVISKYQLSAGVPHDPDWRRRMTEEFGHNDKQSNPSTPFFIFCPQREPDININKEYTHKAF